MRAFGRTPVAGAFARRTPAHINWPRTHGQAASIDPGRTLRRAGPRGARTFFAIFATHRATQRRAHARFGHTSRRRNHARFLARIDFEKRPGAGSGSENGSTD